MDNRDLRRRKTATCNGNHGRSFFMEKKRLEVLFGYIRRLR